MRPPATQRLRNLLEYSSLCARELPKPWVRRRYIARKMWKNALAVLCALPLGNALRFTHMTRRGSLTASVAAIGTAGLGSSPVSADGVADLLYGVQKAPDASVFVGTYTDPIHPGGTRTISLSSTKLGPFQLANIVGGGGEGEPISYELPAMVSPAPGKQGAWQITIDFSPKGGPKDFTGYWDGDGIKFPPTPRQLERGNTVGNRWPKVS